MSSPGEASRARKESLWAQEVATGSRRCRRCGTSKPLAAFGKNTAQRGGLHTYCRVCVADIARAYSRSGQATAIRYGLTVEEYQALGNECRICGDEVAGKGRHVDHDHKCCPEIGRSCGKCVRGILCHNCNTGLGKFRDDPALLGAAIAYLETTRVAAA